MRFSHKYNTSALHVHYITFKSSYCILFVKYKNQLTCSQSRRRRLRRSTLLRWTCPEPARRLARLMMMMMIVRLVRYGPGDRCVGDDYFMLLGYILGAAMSRNNSLHDMFRVQSAKMSTFGCNC